jgi:crotonobetainyl-CoA:carnitine CoA-transferase CaiB-like acyl-CoA transferase
MLLAGTRVLEWAEGLAAPFATHILADLGAEVIKIERPGQGDALRREGPCAAKVASVTDSPLFGYVNAGKRSLTLDPTRPSGAALFRRLAAQCEVLVEAQPPGVLEQIGSGPARLHADNPGLVIVSVTPFGQTGPLRDAASSELTLMHRSGFAWHAARGVSDPPNQPPVASADREGPLACGLAAALAALWGVLGAQVSGAGAHVDVSQMEFYASLLLQETADYSAGERRFDRMREDYRGTEVAGGLVWNLRCNDGWVMASPREDHQWDRWMELLGRPDWSRDAELCGDRVARKRNWTRLQELMSEWTCNHGRNDVARLAQAARVAAFPVSTPDDILDNVQLAHRRFFDRLVLESGTSLAVPGLPFQMRSPDGSAPARGRNMVCPALGEANNEILRDRLALSPAEIEALQRHGII